ncbi:S26 family signal peptidase [Streptomyces fradiae]|uniref:S26 family signal peptidase n=1 Tax=Streptomyces fradiae TaxID=1906 RepID=UPI003F4D4A1F
MLGDNRAAEAVDSRSFGAVPAELVLGRARVAPLLPPPLPLPLATPAKPLPAPGPPVLA